jgi:acyl-CoA reductase-like NAD-dependent aldehyde dehydrogenase
LKIWVNTYNVIPPSSPFGGFKESGFGKELGEEALDEFLTTKAVVIGL